MEKGLCPRTPPEEAFHPRFVEALQKQDHVEYLLDVLLFGETEEKAALITDYGKDVIQLEQRMAELAAADAARTKNTMNAMQPPQSIEEIKAGAGNYRERRCPSEHTELPDRIPA